MKIHFIFSILILLFYIINIGYCKDIKFKVYDFKASQRGFNLNFDQYYDKKDTLPTSGLVLDNLNPSTKKPIYCCGENEHSYIPNQMVYDQSFKDTQDVTKSFIVSAALRSYQNRVEKKNEFYADLPISPATGKGWNQGNNKEHNLNWCMEGHFEFTFKKNSLSFFKIKTSIETIVFLDNKKVIEFSGVSNTTIENKIKINDYGLIEDQKYPLDIFVCQRFDKYRNSDFSLSSPFDLDCINYPGINDDVCPSPVTPTPTTQSPVTPTPTTQPPVTPIVCNALTTCNDNDLCTIDKCKTELYYPNQDLSKVCSHEPVVCPPSLNILGILCTKQRCDSKSGKCVDDHLGVLNC